RGRAPIRLRPELREARRRVLDLVDPLRRRGAELERRRPVAERDRQRPVLRRDLVHRLERNRELEAAAAKLHDLGLEPRGAAGGPALESRDALRFSAHVESPSTTPRASPEGIVQSRTAASSAEWTVRSRGGSARAAVRRPCPLRAASSRPPSGSSLPRR